MKWISAIELPKTGLTRRFEIRTRANPVPNDPEWSEPVGKLLGIAKWHPGWRRFTFFPQPETLYEPDCLRDLADFCEAQTTQRKAERDADGHYFTKQPAGESKCVHCEGMWIEWHDKRQPCPRNAQ